MDLSDRLDLLAMLYRDSGNLSKAISALEESKRLCDEHGVKFDGYDILEEYMKDANVDYLPGVEVSENGKYLVTLLPPSKYASTTTIKDVVAIGISTPRARIEHMKASGTPPPLAPSPSWLPADWIAPRLSSIPVVGLLEHHP